MKTKILLPVFLLLAQMAIAQTNTFPPQGYVGIGTLNPRSILDVGQFIPNGALGAVFGRLTEGDAQGTGTFLGVKGFGSDVLGGKSFSIVHNFYGETNSAINFHRGNSITGGFISFNTDADIERLRIDENGNVGIGTTNPIGIFELKKLNSNLVFDLSTNGLSRIISKGWNASITMNTFRIDGTENDNQLQLNTNGNIGISTATPTEKLSIAGEHGNTKIGLHYQNTDPARQADLLIWASEPGLTYTGSGIGNNITNNSGISRLNTGRGASYIRLLEEEMRFNIIKTNGEDLSALAIGATGNIGIGTITPNEKLAVNGKIRAKEVKVEATNWPDYVFEEGYKVRTLEELESYIKTNKHLPDMPSAKEVETNGIALGEMNKLLLQKIEELTLQLIELNKKVNAQPKEFKSNK